MASKQPEEELVIALRAYQEDFQKHISRAPNPAVQDARALIETATRILRESGLGNALAPTLAEAVRHWHAWQKRDDFMSWVSFPASHIVASCDRNDDKATSLIDVSFSYAGKAYGVRLLMDDRYPMKSTAEFKADNQTVLGLQLERQVEHSGNHGWWDVFAYKPGEWMKDLIEIATHIKKHSEERSTVPRDEYDLERAKNIKL
jgi:hypothetical protein